MRPKSVGEDGSERKPPSYRHKPRHFSGSGIMTRRRSRSRRRSGRGGPAAGRGGPCPRLARPLLVVGGAPPPVESPTASFGRRGGAFRPVGRASHDAPSSCPWRFVPLAGSCFVAASFVRGFRLGPELAAPQAVSAGLAGVAFRPKARPKPRGTADVASGDALVWLVFSEGAFLPQPATPSFQRAFLRPYVVFA